jgi:hypothetical protein
MQDLGPGRVEPPEDVGKGGDLWHGRAGAVDELQLSLSMYGNRLFATSGIIHIDAHSFSWHY